MKKKKFSEKQPSEVIIRIDLKKLQDEIMKASKKHIPRMLNIYEVMELIRQYDYMITIPQFFKIVKEFSIPFNTDDEMFDREVLFKFFRCDGRPVPNFEHDIIRYCINEQQRERNKRN